MHDTEQRLSHLEEQQEILQMHNRVLATALKGLLRALPAEWAVDAAEAIELALEEELAELQYRDSPHTEAFHQAVDAFFHHRRGD